MLWNEQITLIAVTCSNDSVGNYQKSKTDIVVFANEKSVTRAEFYQAHAVNLRPDKVFEIRKIDYAEQVLMSHNGAEYDIMRTYSNNPESIELVCSKVVGV